MEKPSFDLENFKNPNVELVPDRHYVLRTPDDSAFVCFYRIKKNDTETYTIEISDGVYDSFNRRNFYSFAQSDTRNRVSIENSIYSKLGL